MKCLFFVYLYECVWTVEDFSFYELEKPGAFFHVGVADPERPITSTPHHNCHFQIDERGLMDALRMKVAVYLQALAEEN